MESQKFKRIKIVTVGIVSVFIFGVLFWEHFNGGVISHNILNNRDLPAISNWWGGLLMPILTWFLLGRIEKRLEKKTQAQPPEHFMGNVFWLFVTGLVFGIVLSVSFANQFKPFLDNVPFILIALSFAIPLYYSEFILGFILGMTVTFGAILPTVFILVIAAIGIVTYKFIRPMILRLIAKIRK